jgi:hypothetical protein
VFGAVAISFGTILAGFPTEFDGILEHRLRAYGYVGGIPVGGVRDLFHSGRRLDGAPGSDALATEPLSGRRDPCQIRPERGRGFGDRSDHQRQCRRSGTTGRAMECARGAAGALDRSVPRTVAEWTLGIARRF